MYREIKTDYCIFGAGVAGTLLALRLASSGKKILILDQGPRYSEEDRSRMIDRQKKTLNDFADYNYGEKEGIVTPHTSAEARDDVAQWRHQRVFGVGGTALHFEGNMMRPIREDLQVKSLYGYGRDWPIDYREIEPWLLEAEREVGVSGKEDNPYASERSGPFPMPAHPFSYFDREIMGPALKRLGITGHSSAR